MLAESSLQMGAKDTGVDQCFGAIERQDEQIQGRGRRHGGRRQQLQQQLPRVDVLVGSKGAGGGSRSAWPS